MVALDVRRAYGDERGDDAVSEKSPAAERFVLHPHPVGRDGVVVESNAS
jgi:hypothetical protein